VSGAYWMSQRAERMLVDGASLGADLDLLAGAARGCDTLSQHLALCAVVEVGVMRAGGFGVMRATTRRKLGVAPGVGARLPWRLAGPVFLVGQIELGLPLTRPNVAIVPMPGDLYQPAVVVGRGWLGVEAAF